MAHLPIEIHQLVYPFLQSIGRKLYYPNGHSLSVFNLLTDYGIEEVGDERLLDDLIYYHWWWLSSQDYDDEFYRYIDEQIPFFNASQNICDLHLKCEPTDGTRLLFTDSDTGSFSFLIFATSKEGLKPLNYTLPTSKKKTIEKLMKKKRKGTLPNPITWVEDNKFAQMNEKFCKYINYYYTVNTEDIRRSHDKDYDLYASIPGIKNPDEEAKKFLQTVEADAEFPKLTRYSYVKPEHTLQEYINELLSTKMPSDKFTELWNKIQIMTGGDNMINVSVPEKK